MAQVVMIAGPSVRVDISDRYLDCEFALEAAFLDLVDRAQRAGWQTIEIDAALVRLADNHMLGELENIRTDQAIQEAIRHQKD